MAGKNDFNAFYEGEVDTITTEQLAGRLQIGRSKAIEIMNAIKSVSDTFGVCGMIHKQDYIFYLDYRRGKTKKNFSQGEENND